MIRQNEIKHNESRHSGPNVGYAVANGPNFSGG